MITVIKREGMKKPIWYTWKPTVLMFIMSIVLSANHFDPSIVGGVMMFSLTVLPLIWLIGSYRWNKKHSGYQQSPKIASELVSDNSHDLKSYLKNELSKSELIKEDFKHIVLDHYLEKTNLLKTGNKLTRDEKKEIGINTRLSVTKELIEVLTDDAIANEANPKEIISNIYHKARTAKYRHDELINMKKLGITQFTLMNCGDERDCEWSQLSSSKKFNVNDDINSLIESKCDASYCRCGFQAEIKF